MVPSFPKIFVFSTKPAEFQFDKNDYVLFLFYETTESDSSTCLNFTSSHAIEYNYES